MIVPPRVRAVRGPGRFVPILAAAVYAPLPLGAQYSDAPSAADTATPAVEAGPFDNGRMWTFEYPPTEYLDQTYGLRPDQAWWEKARMGALRIPSCSASLVSASGLVMTNHHCAREFVSQVSEAGEDLLDNGFYAATLDEERLERRQVQHGGVGFDLAEIRIKGRVERHVRA